MFDKTALDTTDSKVWGEFCRRTCKWKELHVSAEAYCNLCAAQADLLRLTLCNDWYFHMADVFGGRQQARIVELIRRIKRQAGLVRPGFLGVYEQYRHHPTE